jgi:hypothetical protein
MPVLVRAVVVPVTRAVMGMVVVMAAGSGQRIAHASEHASDRALRHINTWDPEAGAKEMHQRRELGRVVCTGLHGHTVTHVGYGKHVSQVSRRQRIAIVCVTEP